MKDLETLNLVKYDVISFDIYDTLLKRDVHKPSRVFYYVEKKVGGSFCKNRIEAEKEARLRSKAEEITIEDIYKLLPGSVEWKSKAFDYEMKIEEKICAANEEIVNFLFRCREMGKRILIISDMYLPRDLIEQILFRNNIPFDALYVSSEIKCTKRTGNLYEYVRKAEHIDVKKWVHIGDNKKSDFYQPRRLGIKSLLVSPGYDKNILFPIDEEDSQKDLTAFISNRVNGLGMKENYHYHIGYEGLGPLLWGFIKWLKTEIEKESIKKVFFLSRDGQIMEAAYNLFNGSTVDHCYMYASRRALIVPSIFLSPKLEDIRKNMFWPRYGTISSFLKKVGLQPQEYTEQLSNVGLSEKQTYVYSDLFDTNCFRNFYNSIIEDVVANSKKEYEALLTYLKDIGFNGKVGLVDIGWHGNMQKALLRIAKYAGLDAQIYGYYIGMNPETEHTNAMKGYVFDCKKNEEAFYRERLFTCIFEMLFSANHGSVIKFVNGESVVELEEFEYKNGDNDYEIIKNIQKGALQFIKDIEDAAVVDYCNDELYGFERLAKIGIKPTKRDSVSFGEMKALRDEVTKMAEPKSRIYYLLHPKSLLNDVKNAPWRIGFLKRLTGLSLPYYKLYYSLKKEVIGGF